MEERDRRRRKKARKEKSKRARDSSDLAGDDGTAGSASLGHGARAGRGRAITIHEGYCTVRRVADDVGGPPPALERNVRAGREQCLHWYTWRGVGGCWLLLELVQHEDSKK